VNFGYAAKGDSFPGTVCQWAHSDDLGWIAGIIDDGNELAPPPSTQVHPFRRSQASNSIGVGANIAGWEQPL
jgi:hypothetical protein